MHSRLLGQRATELVQALQFLAATLKSSAHIWPKKFAAGPGAGPAATDPVQGGGQPGAQIHKYLNTHPQYDPCTRKRLCQDCREWPGPAQFCRSSCILRSSSSVSATIVLRALVLNFSKTKPIKAIPPNPQDRLATIVWVVAPCAG